jgi:hypothetical protein
MKNPLAEKIKRFRAGADEARERMAETVFKLETVLDAMALATSKGYRAAKIVPPLPLELSGTEAALELTKQLKQAGATVEWVPRQPTDPNAGERYSELVVKW